MGNSASEDYPQEMLDFYKVLDFGRQKHGHLNFLDPDGSKCSLKDMHASIFRHLAQSSVDGHAYGADSEGDWDMRYDGESGLDPLLHVAARALILYCRIKRRIRHPDD